MYPACVTGSRAVALIARWLIIGDGGGSPAILGGKGFDLAGLAGSLVIIGHRWLLLFRDISSHFNAESGDFRGEARLHTAQIGLVSDAYCAMVVVGAVQSELCSE